MQLNPHLAFNGECEAAFKFYENCLGGKIVTMMTYGDSPMAEQMPPAWRGKIIHAAFALSDHQLTGADVPPESYLKPQGFYVLLHIGAEAEADRIFKALAENGAVRMPVQETFWARRFGMLVDQFGTPWMINCGKPA
ncbi:MAG: VOC family protein [Terriglobales bacterium]|jgi:PhnB protein